MMCFNSHSSECDLNNMFHCLVSLKEMLNRNVSVKMERLIRPHYTFIDAVSTLEAVTSHDNACNIYYDYFNYKGLEETSGARFNKASRSHVLLLILASI